MQFDLIHFDVPFDAHDPLMLSALIYACLWLILSMILFVGIVLAPQEVKIIRSRIRIIITFAFCLLGAPMITRAVVLFAVNALQGGKGIHIGMHWGPPPTWISIAAVITGIGLGVFLVTWKKSKDIIINLVTSSRKSSTNKQGGRARALFLSLLFPGMGQVYRGQCIAGYFLFLLACLFVSHDLFFVPSIFFLTYAVAGAIFLPDSRIW